MVFLWKLMSHITLNRNHTILYAFPKSIFVITFIWLSKQLHGYALNNMLSPKQFLWLLLFGFQKTVFLFLIITYRLLNIFPTLWQDHLSRWIEGLFLISTVLNRFLTNFLPGKQLQYLRQFQILPAALLKRNIIQKFYDKILLSCHAINPVLYMTGNNDWEAGCTTYTAEKNTIHLYMSFILALIFIPRRSVESKRTGCGKVAIKQPFFHWA